MKTVIFLISMFFVCNTALMAQPTRIEIKTKNDFQLKGNVKQVVNDRTGHTLKFTPEGYLLHIGWRDSPERGETYTYDKAGRLVKYKMASNANNFQIKTYQYNMKGLMIKYTRNDEKNKPYHETYQYDQNGNIRLQIGELGKPMFEFRNTYDGQKRIIKIEQLFPSSKRVISTKVISYLPNGWSKHILTSKMQKVITEYDNKGRMRSETHWDMMSGEIYLSITNCYDSNDNLIQSQQDEHQINNTYNELGEQISKEETEPDGTSSKTVYIYRKHDAKGNWTERIVSNLSTYKRYTETRTITYHDNANTPPTTNPFDAFFGKSTTDIPKSGEYVIPQKGEFVASAPNTVAIGEQFQLNFSIGLDKVDNFKAPSLNNFNVLVGPTSSKYSSTSIINGSTVYKASVTYKYILKAEKGGSFTIPGAVIESGGKTYTSNAVTIKVTSNN